MLECPICAAEMTLEADTLEGELITCDDCGSDLEVTSLNPPAVIEAPQEEEDWGE